MKLSRSRLGIRRDRAARRGGPLVVVVVMVT
jgi:hypothetical protein